MWYPVAPNNGNFSRSVSTFISSYFVLNSKHSRVFLTSKIPAWEKCALGS